MKKPYLVRTIIFAGSLLLQLSTLCFHSRGAAGDVDLSFDPGSGVNGTVNAVAVQPDGKVIIGGWFTTVKGLKRFKIARLNADGSGDSSFDPGASLDELSDVDSYVSSVVLQPDGRVLIGGVFIIGGFNGIARLNADGTLDSSFDSSEVNATLTSIALQPDGKVLIGGAVLVKDPNNFGTNLHGITRLNANGTFDSSFNVSQVTVGYGSASCVALQPDGKVLVGGYLLDTNGIQYGIARLNANGSVDSSFNPGSGANSIVHSIACQTDLKVLIGGEFNSVNGTNRKGIARLNANGSLDSSFNPFNPVTGVTGYAPAVNSVVVQTNGKVVIGGAFYSMNPTNRTSIARLNADGSPDGSFNPGTSANSDVYSVILQPDGRVLIGGRFTSVNGTNRNRMARLNADGSLNGGFDPGGGIESSSSSLVVQPDGKVLIGGALTFINGTNRYGSARLNANGSADSSFIPSSFNPDLSFVIRAEDCWAGPPNFECSQSWVASAVLVQPDGNLLVVGYSITVVLDLSDNHPFTSYRSFLARVHADGSHDISFALTIGANSNVPEKTALAVQPDGKVLVCRSYSGVTRLNANGSLDNSFNSVISNWVSSIALQADGKILIAGGFSTLHGTNVSYGIARLNADGSLDGSFNPGTGTFGVSSGVLQSDGKVLIGGDFNTVNGTNRNRIARLNPDGTLDNSFKPGTGADGNVSSIALQPDGNILISGDFTSVNGVLRPHVARLYGDSASPRLSIARSNAFVIVSWLASALNFQLRETTNLALPNAWSPVAQLAVTNGAQISVTVVSGHSKPAREGQMKTSHFESGIAHRAAKAALMRDVPTQREPATFHRHFGGQRLVGAQNCP